MAKAWSSLDLSQSDYFIVPVGNTLGETGSTGSVKYSTGSLYYSDGESWVNSTYIISVNGDALPSETYFNIIPPPGGTVTDNPGENSTIMDFSNILPTAHRDVLYDYSDTTGLTINLMWSVLQWPTGSMFLIGKTTGSYHMYLPTTGISAGWTYEVITKSTMTGGMTIYQSVAGDDTSPTLIIGAFYETNGVKLVLVFNGTNWKYYAIPLTSFAGNGPTIQS